jgi:hypothetical protein
MNRLSYQTILDENNDQLHIFPFDEATLHSLSEACQCEPFVFLPADEKALAYEGNVPKIILHNNLLL